MGVHRRLFESRAVTPLPRDLLFLFGPSCCGLLSVAVNIIKVFISDVRAVMTTLLAVEDQVVRAVVLLATSPS